MKLTARLIWFAAIAALPLAMASQGDELDAFIQAHVAQRQINGGNTVMQLLVTDVTGKLFPQYMSEAVLGPLGMKDSTYQQPLPTDRAAQTASGYYADRSPVSGRWHVYPEMAAAGLWTTATDLARFAVEVQLYLMPSTELSMMVATVDSVGNEFRVNEVKRLFPM